MCGIVGIFNFDQGRDCSIERLTAMRDLLHYRGPDDHGIYTDANLGLAHRRLSIVDIGSGHQPMMTPEEDLCVVFNGEIYNYVTLRRELEARGRVFRTNSDTEVLLHLYREYGERCVTFLNGIFAFAIWEKNKRKLFLARDHMGIKPLYFHSGSRSFVFASEVKAIFASGELTAQCNIEAVPEYFIFRQVAGTRTLFKDVQSLLPGHSITIENGRLSIQQYWSPLGRSEQSVGNFHETTEKLDALLTDAVSMQMMSDVPLGTFCSGGIDSSLVTALCARAAGRPINTYSVGFHESEFDETVYARMVSSQYQTVHHELRLTNDEFTQHLPATIWHNDEPLNFPNSVLVYAISKLAKERVTVVLTGEGADELFAGYPRYYIPTLIGKAQHLPAWMRNLVARAVDRVGGRRLHMLGSQLGKSMNDVLLYNSATLGHELRRSLQTDSHGFEYRHELLEKLKQETGWLKRMSLLDQHTYLVSILNRQDKMSMAASVESRVPLLDYRIVEFANSLPDRYRQGYGVTKRILKEVARRYLPKQVVDRKKSGFGIPLAEWLRADNGLGVLAQQVLSEVKLHEFADSKTPMSLLAEHRAGRSDHSDFLWSAVNFLLWKRQFGIA